MTTLSLPETLPERRSILVVHREGVGDDILSIPFLSILAAERKDHDLYLFIGPARGDLFLGLDGFAIVESWEREKVAAALERFHDIVFDLGTRHDHLTDWLFEPGDLRYGTYVGFRKAKTVAREVALQRSLDVPIWEQFISLASAIGIPTDSATDWAIETSHFSKTCVEMLVDVHTDSPLVCIAPGTAGDLGKRWPPEHFAALIRELHAKRPCSFVLVGEQFEMGIGDIITGLVDTHIDNLMGLTTVGCFVHVIKQSSLVVANDNGAMHLGGLLNIPTVGLFGPSDSVHFRPLGNRSVVLRSPSGNIAYIDPAAVTAACLRLLEPDTVSFLAPTRSDRG